MAGLAKPCEDNGYLVEHIAILRRSYRHWTGRDLVSPHYTDIDAARFLFEAPQGLVSHDTAKDPVFNYANQTALGLFAMSWEEMTSLPSRFSAENANREERAHLLEQVNENGFIDSYHGIRIGRHGRRFRIENATVWKLFMDTGQPYGQAAYFSHWEFL